MAELELREELGKGQYGVVQKVFHKPTKVIMAMKVHCRARTNRLLADGADLTAICARIQEIRLELDTSKLNQILMELDVLHKSHSPYIVEFYGAFFIESCVYYCMEYMDAGSLDWLFPYKGGAPEVVLKAISYSVVKGLKFLKEELSIIHRDVKPTNVLANTKGQIKLCDFGVSGQLIQSLAKTNIGCQSYMAPERIALADTGAYTVASDVWSFGISCLEVGSGQYPYPADRYDSIYAQLSAIIHESPPDLPADRFSPDAIDFVQSCLQKDPTARATYPQLLEHRFIADFDEQAFAPTMAAWVTEALAWHMSHPEAHVAANPPKSSLLPNSLRDMTVGERPAGSALQLFLIDIPQLCMVFVATDAAPVPVPGSTPPLPPPNDDHAGSLFRRSMFRLSLRGSRPSIATPPPTASPPAVASPVTNSGGHLSPMALAHGSSYSSASSVRSVSSTGLSSVVETSNLVKTVDDVSGTKQINNYLVLQELGRGVHGKVKLARRTDTGELVAMKILRKTTRTRRLGFANLNRLTASPAGDNGIAAAAAAAANSQLEKIRREIAIMKKLRHPNVVQLYEVIDDPSSDKVYIVLEYLAGGEIKWKRTAPNADSSGHLPSGRLAPTAPLLSVDEARAIFRDIVAGLEYLHSQGIIHRDVKPANLIRGADGRVKFDPSGRLYFAGKAVLHADGVDFSSGNSYKINMAELELREELGKGQYGVVQKVFHKPTKVIMAMKVHCRARTNRLLADGADLTAICARIQEIRLELDTSKLNQILMELDVLHKSHSPYIVEFYGAFFIESCQINNYLVLQELGRGVHGKVKLARRTDTGELVAMKILRKTTRTRRLGFANLNRLTASPAGDNGIAAAAAAAANSQLEKIRREIAIMKKLRHPNVVQLYEVIDDPSSDKVYIVLEYLAGGEIKWKRTAPNADSSGHLPSGRLAPTAPLLSVDEARAIFRDIVAGLEYLHSQGIIHRDVKPANLIRGADGRVKLSDFGVSHFSPRQFQKEQKEIARRRSSLNLSAAAASSVSPAAAAMKILRKSTRTRRLGFANLNRLTASPAGDNELAKTAGSPAFFAPELCVLHDEPSSAVCDVAGIDSPSSASAARFPITKAIDIWAAGVTLYCLVFGCCPFVADSEFELFERIPVQPLTFPEDMLPLDPDLEDLFRRVLDKNPETRATLADIKHHPWVRRGLSDTGYADWLAATDPVQYEVVEVSDAEVREAVSSGLMERIKRQWARLSVSLLNVAGSVLDEFLSPSSSPTTPRAPPTGRDTAVYDAFRQRTNSPFRRFLFRCGKHASKSAHVLSRSPDDATGSDRGSAMFRRGSAVDDYDDADEYGQQQNSHDAHLHASQPERWASAADGEDDEDDDVDMAALEEEQERRRQRTWASEFDDDVLASISTSHMHVGPDASRGTSPSFLEDPDEDDEGDDDDDDGLVLPSSSAGGRRAASAPAVAVRPWPALVAPVPVDKSQNSITELDESIVDEDALAPMRGGGSTGSAGAKSWLTGDVPTLPSRPSILIDDEPLVDLSMDSLVVQRNTRYVDPDEDDQQEQDASATLPGAVGSALGFPAAAGDGIASGPSASASRPMNSSDAGKGGPCI
ncbi:CAMKK/ELM protein kinase, variant [Allomyces macrogynus ATCC 38327]|nr:CAMKK/ELM protein kinase, variant [Allomyces macrogynus ATCC 38327]|eukprot:KNE66869.1 CAMKK/ELM protein kinase, variant [Allomyces macrogynus ATCC 38327]